MADLVDIKGNRIETPPHVADVTEILRATVDKLETGAEFHPVAADRVIVIVGFEDGAQYLAFNRDLTVAQTLWMLEREKHDLLERAGRSP